MLSRPRGQFVAGLLAVVVLASATLAGCGESADRSVKIVEPAEGATLNAGDIKVAVEVKKFNVVDEIGQAANEGEGHIHYYIDAGEIPTKDGQPAVTKSNNTYHAQATKDYTWPNVSAGDHTFAAPAAGDRAGHRYGQGGGRSNNPGSLSGNLAKRDLIACGRERDADGGPKRSNRPGRDHRRYAEPDGTAGKRNANALGPICDWSRSCGYPRRAKRCRPIST